LQLVQVVTIIQRVSSFFLFPMEGHNSWSDQCSHISGSFYANAACSFCFRFGGCPPLHNSQSMIYRSGGGQPFYKVQCLIFCNPLYILVARFTNSSPKIFLLNPSNVRRSCICCLSSLLQFLILGPSIVSSHLFVFSGFI
jgi:hypothetical protein